jgi:hypothetical protein
LPRIAGVHWKRALAPLAALVLLASLSCQEDERGGRERVTATPEPTAAAALVQAGLWAATGVADIGLAMRVEPAADLDAGPWRFIRGSSAVLCAPALSEDAWVFEDCKLESGAASGFRAVARRQANPDIEVSLGANARASTYRYVPERTEPQARAVTLAWHAAKSSECEDHTGIWVQDGVVFAPCRSGDVELLDAASGRRLGRASQEGTKGRASSAAMEVTARDGRLYAATTGRGIVIWDVGQPAQAWVLGQYIDEQGGSQSAVVMHTLTLSPRGNLLFAVNQSHAQSDVRIIDVSDPSKPRLAGRYLPRNSSGLRGGAHDLALEERDGKLIAYLNQLGGGFHILDVTDPANIIEVSELSWANVFSHSAWPFQRGATRYVAHTDEGYDQGLSIIDVTDMTQPRVASRFKSREGLSIHNIRVEGGFAYISYYLDGLRVVDLRNPESPREVAHYDTVRGQDEVSMFSGAWGVHVEKGIVYISDTMSGVYAFGVDLPR